MSDHIKQIVLSILLRLFYIAVFRDPTKHRINTKSINAAIIAGILPAFVRSRILKVKCRDSSTRKQRPVSGRFIYFHLYFVDFPGALR